MKKQEGAVFRRILHPTDFSPVAMDAFDHALDLARRHGARLRVVHAMVLHGYDPEVIRKGLPKLEEAERHIEADLKREMESMAERAVPTEVECDTAFRRGLAPAEVILEEARDFEADLVVMGTHGHSPLRQFFLGGVAERVVRYAACPVMTLGRETHEPGPYRAILLPIDFSRGSHAAAELAVRMARADGATLHVAHVFQEIVPPYFSAFGDAFQWDPELRGRCERAMDELMQEHGIDPGKVVKHVREGRVSSTLVELARKNQVDLIVMGTRGLSGISHFLLGSVAEKVVRKAGPPVLTVHGDEDEEEAP
jgi:nucleotide-binding universal stress UspA family protein